MNYFIQQVVGYLTSPTFGVILSLLLVFQWYKQHAKEQAVKNFLFAMRRKVERWKVDKHEPGRAADVMEDIDAVLATLGARDPFQKALEFVTRKVFDRNEAQATTPLGQVSPFNF